MPEAKLPALFFAREKSVNEIIHPRIRDHNLINKTEISQIRNQKSVPIASGSDIRLSLLPCCICVCIQPVKAR